MHVIEDIEASKREMEASKSGICANLWRFHHLRVAIYLCVYVFSV